MPVPEHDMLLYASDDTGDLADLLDWSVLIGEDPTVIGTKTGRLQSTLRYRCPDTAQMPPEARAQYLSRLHTILGTLQADWAADWDWWHLPAHPYPASQWVRRVDWLVDELRRLDYGETPRHESTAYLTLSWQPPRGQRRWLRDLFLTQAIRQQRQQQDKDIASFQMHVIRITQRLAELVQVEPLDADATCTYLYQSLHWEHQATVRCPDPPIQLDQQLGAGAFVPGQPPMVNDQWVQPLYIQTWQPELGTWIPEILETMPFPCRWHVRWAPLAAPAAAKFLRWEEKRWAGSYRRGTHILKAVTSTPSPAEVDGRDTRADAIAAGQSILTVQTEVLTGEEVLGTLTPTLLTWATDQDTLGQRVGTLEAVLFGQGLVATTERAGASLAWVASLPGHVHLGTRGRALRTQELTALMPHASVWTGPARNAHLNGPPVIVASTEGTPFRLVTHVGELGHQMLVGPSRAGKSGYLGLFARQWSRYPGARMAIFDRDNALKCATVMGGGVHYALGTPESRGFHPLGRIETETEQRWALTWLEGVLTGEGLAPSPDERDELWAMVQRLAGLPAAQRTLSMARRLLQVQRLKVGLTPFCEGGPYSFFDATADSFAVTEETLCCFEMAHLLALPRSIGPTLSYLFHRLETDWFTGAPVHIIIDEAKWLLDLGPFVGEVELWLKARAKKNVGVTLSTQELFDVQQTSAWQAILASIPTWLFLPNAAAIRPEVATLYRSAGLTDTDMETLAHAQPLRDYLYRSPLGTRLFQLRLSPVERLLCAASRLEELQILDVMLTQETAESLPGAWLRHWGYPEEAALLDPQEVPAWT